MSAPRRTLDSLHARLTETLDLALGAEEAKLRAHNLLVEAAEAKEDIEGLVSAVLAAKTVDTTLLRVIAAFLKDNEVTAPPVMDEGEETQLDRLNRLKAKRRVADTPHDQLN